MPTDASDDDDDRLYRVIVNREDQYSIWPADREQLPLGWTVVGEPRSKQACLDYIEEVWVDMRPLSLRQQREQEARRRGEDNA
ncbi:MAG: MbtH family protein [Oceanicaulis sp.]